MGLYGLGLFNYLLHKSHFSPYMYVTCKFVWLHFGGGQIDLILDV
jgi:hypothetical protein